MVTGAGHRSRGERTSKLSPAARLYVAAVVAAAVAVLAQALGADPDLDGPVSQSWTMAALERLRLDTATEYDPRVVEALAQIAYRRYRSRR